MEGNGVDSRHADTLVDAGEDAAAGDGGGAGGLREAHCKVVRH